jgi:hypothetical protein
LLLVGVAYLVTDCALLFRMPLFLRVAGCKHTQKKRICQR